MSDSEIFSLISLISYIASGVFLVLAVFFWFKFRIPSVIGDLSGRTAKKSIARMRANNEKTGGQGYRPSAANAARGKLTGTMPEVQRKAVPQMPVQPAAGDQMPETGLLGENRAHTVQSQATELLVDNEVTGMLVDSDATAVLTESGTTTLLVENRAQPPRRSAAIRLTMLDEVMLIHTNEVIG